MTCCCTCELPERGCQRTFLFALRPETAPGSQTQDSAYGSKGWRHGVEMGWELGGDEARENADDGRKQLMRGGARPIMRAPGMSGWYGDAPFYEHRDRRRSHLRPFSSFLFTNTEPALALAIWHGLVDYGVFLLPLAAHF